MPVTSSLSQQFVPFLQEITFPRAEGARLGLAVMGGSDRPGHVFHKGDRPGIVVTCVSVE